MSEPNRLNFPGSWCSCRYLLRFPDFPISFDRKKVLFEVGGGISALCSCRLWLPLLGVPVGGGIIMLHQLAMFYAHMHNSTTKNITKRAVLLLLYTVYCSMSSLFVNFLRVRLLFKIVFLLNNYRHIHIPLSRLLSKIRFY